MSSHEDHDHQLALFCQQLPRLRRMYRGPVGAARRLAIDRAVTAARAGEPIEEHLAALGLPLRRSAPDVQEDEARSTLPPRVADAAPRALLGVHVCPRGVCARREQRSAGAQRPVCEVFDLALRFEAES
ncbi:hypothetical protein [Streptomyces sp. NPDC001435]|uniref:hypothetical protein n=1 Tax=unclassified Streptomyces TaxID=2593676 RepID=UPI0036899EAF